jgi:tryptophan synthase alpha chain
MQITPGQNRIDQKFVDLREAGGKGFIAYIGAGDPDLARTLDLALALEGAGVDILELGVPFSDPLADGAVNQAAASRALAAGATVAGVLDCVRELRTRSAMPVVLYTYLNPIYAFGFDRFLAGAAAAGVDGVLVLDLPPDEAGRNEELRQRPPGLRMIRLIAPTTPPDRIAQIAAAAEGFLYFVSREGVTGEQQTVSASLAEQVAAIRAVSVLPVAVGFGISTPAQARETALSADAVVVGSAIVRKVADFSGQPDLAERVAAFVRPMVEAVKKEFRQQP